MGLTVHGERPRQGIGALAFSLAGRLHRHDLAQIWEPVRRGIRSRAPLRQR